MASRVEGVTVNAGTCSVLSHLAGGADRELLRARHGGLVTRDIRDLPVLRGVVRQGAGVAEAKLLRRSALGTARLLNHLEAVVGSAHRVKQLDLRGLLVRDRQARSRLPVDGEARLLPDVARRQRRTGRRGVLTQVADRRAHRERLRKGHPLTPRDLDRPSPRAPVSIDAPAAPVRVHNRLPAREARRRRALRQRVVKGHRESNMLIHLLGVVRRNPLGDTEVALTRPHRRLHRPRHDKQRRLTLRNLGPLNRDRVGVLSPRKRSPTDPVGPTNEAGPVGDRVVGLLPEGALRHNGDRRRPVRPHLPTLAGDLEGALAMVLRPRLGSFVQQQRLGGVVLRVDGVEVDLLQRACHACAERVIEGDGPLRDAIEGHAEGLDQPRPSEVEVPQRLRVTLLHDAVVTLVQPHVRAVGAAGRLRDPTLPGEVNLDFLVKVDLEGQLLRLRGRDSDELEIPGPMDVLVSRRDQRGDPLVEGAGDGLAVDGALTQIHVSLVVMDGPLEGRVEVQLLGQGDREGVTRLRRRLRRVPLKRQQSQALEVAQHQLSNLRLILRVHLGEPEVGDLDLGVNSGCSRRSKPLDHDTQGRQERHGNTGHSRSHRPG